ncbi:MAG: NUDIX domain-containing protein [Patescibacteria group bacterium]
MNWNEFDKGVFIVNALGIVYNFKTKKILIGKREEDPFIKKLSWCFPGGRPAYKKDLEFYLKKEIKKKTGSNVKVREIIFAKTYPENRKFLSIYYHCDFVGGKEKSGEKFVEIKWIKPIEVRKYFTTSIHEKLFDYLEKLR